MNKDFKDLISKFNSASVLGEHISKRSYVPIDLSINNRDLQRINVSSSDALGSYINQSIASQHGLVGYGGYLETRDIYNRSSYFNSSGSHSNRNIHLGLDLWIDAETPIYAPLNGKVHSFQNNTNFGDYGPTMILEHNVQNYSFYTLYGHLSLESIQRLKIGQEFQKGEYIAALGDTSVNGDYPPHLHFQIIKDLQGNFGDYPGVSSIDDLEFYKNNCLDPNLLLITTTKI